MRLDAFVVRLIAVEQTFDELWIQLISQFGHKDLRPVEYVVADVGGRYAAPIYGMMQVQDLLTEKDYTAPDGTRLVDEIYWTSPPPDDTKSGFASEETAP